MDLSDIIKNVDTFIGDSSNDRVNASDRYQATTEATAWLLEELGNEHMVDRVEVEYLPTVTWYKMENLTPYLLTAGQLRFKEEDGKERGDDFTRLEPRDLATVPSSRYAYAIEQYDGDSYLGINLPPSEESNQKDLIQMNVNDGLTYTGVNATNITGEAHAIRFDMTASGPTVTGLTTTSGSIDLSSYASTGVLIFELEIPDVSDVNSVSIKFGDDVTANYYLGTVTQDVNGNPLSVGVNTIKVAMADLTTVGSPDNTDITAWGFYCNHDTGKAQVDTWRLSDLRVADPIFLTFKYIFYRVGKDTSGTDLIEFSATTDVPFFIERYPQYRFAVAHKAASILFRSMQAHSNAGSEESQARKALKRYRKNFSTERDGSNSAFKLAGVRFRGLRFIRRK